MPIVGLKAQRNKKWGCSNVPMIKRLKNGLGVESELVETVSYYQNMSQRKYSSFKVHYNATCCFVLV